MRDSGDSGGDGAGVSVSVSSSVAVAVVRISRPLGNVDGSKRVSPVVAGGSVAVGLVGSDGGGGAVAADGNGGRGGGGSVGSSESGGASGKNSAVAMAVSSVPVSTESTVAVRAVVGISLSLPLGNVASSNGVSDVVAGSSIAVGLVGSDSLHTVSTVSSIASVASVANMAGVAKAITAVAGVAQAVAVGAIVGVGLSGSQGQAASLNSEILKCELSKKDHTKEVYG